MKKRHVQLLAAAALAITTSIPLQGCRDIPFFSGSLRSNDLADFQPPPPSDSTGSEGPWVSAYLASWQHNAGTPYTNWGIMSVEDIEWSMTHLIYFALNVGPDGTPGESIDPTQRHNFTTDRFRDIVPVAHEHGVKILFSVGGAGNYRNFSRVIANTAKRRQLIETIRTLIREHGFDGVDIDMEPIRDGDVPHYIAFITELHTSLRQMRTRQGASPILTAAINGQFRMFARLQTMFDQINMMTYDLSGPWQGWQAWHNSPLFSDGVRFNSTGEQKPSVDLWVRRALAAGLRPEKIGIGIDFYGYIWNGVKQPQQPWPWNQVPTLDDPGGGTPYRVISERFDLADARWDAKAQVPYLSIEDPQRFVSYDDTASVRAKVDYVKRMGLGGMILWELSGGYLPGMPSGERHPLLNAVHQEVSARP